MKKYQEKNMLVDLKNSESKREIRKILNKNHYIKSFSFKHFANLYIKKITVNNEKYNHIVIILYASVNETLKNINLIKELSTKKKNTIVTVCNYTNTFESDITQNNLIISEQGISTLSINNIENTPLENSIFYSKNYPLVHTINAKFAYKVHKKLKFKKMEVDAGEIFGAIFEFILELIFEVLGNL